MKRIVSKQIKKWVLLISTACFLLLAVCSEAKAELTVSENEIGNDTAIYNNYNFGSAYQMTAGTVYSFSKPTEDNYENYFKFTLPSAQKVVVSLALQKGSESSETDALYFMDDEQNSICGYNDISYSDYFELTCTSGTKSKNYTLFLNAGTYYINVNNEYASTSAVTNISYTAAAVDNQSGSDSTWDAPVTLTSGTPAKAVKVESGNTYYRYTFTTSAFAKVTTSFTIENDAVIPATAKTSEYSVNLLSGSDRNEMNGYVNGTDYKSEYSIKTDTSSKTITTTYFLCPGTHYILVDSEYASSGCKSTITVNISNSAKQDAGDSLTANNNSRNTATALQLGSTIYNGNIGYLGGNATSEYGYMDEKDCYKFTVTDSTPVRLYFTALDSYNSSNNATIILYNGNGAIIGDTVNVADRAIGQEFTVDYNNLGVGTYYLEINGEYATPMEYILKAKSITSLTKATATLSKTSYVYSGSAITPTATLMHGTKKLVLGTDYTVQYKYNTYPGIGQVIITGKGDYLGTKTEKFQIKPSTITISAKAGSKKATVKWNKAVKVSGYEVYMATSKNGKYKKIKTASKSSISYTQKKLTKGKKYYFKVRAYVTVDGKKIYGSYSKIKYVKVK